MLRLSPGITTALTSVAVFCSALLIWEAIVVAFRVPEFLLPSPLAVGREFFTWPGLLAYHTSVTLLETVLGLAFAIAVAVPLAIAVVYSRVLSATIYPLLLLLQSVPKVAFAPLFLIWMGIGMSSKVLVATLVAFFPIVIDTATGLRAVEPEMLELTRSLRATPMQVFLQVRLPHAMPAFFSGLKVAVTLAIIGAVIGEFVGSDDRGIGYFIYSETAAGNTARAFASVVVLAALGIVFYGAVAVIEHVLLPWRRIATAVNER
jgi:NitT/TauT family transport system permease protein